MVERDHSRPSGDVVMRKYLAIAALILFPALGKCEISADSLILSLAKMNGHRLLSQKPLKISPKEDSLFHTQAWKEYSFKSIRTLPNQGRERYYFQYSASLMTYKDSTAASKRLDSLLIDLDEMDRHFKTSRLGLQIGNKLVYLRTEPTIYYPALAELHRNYLESWASSRFGKKRMKQDTLFTFCSGWVCSLYAFNKQGRLKSIEATLTSTQTRRAWGKVWNAHSTCGQECTYDFFYDAGSGKQSKVIQAAIATDSTKNRVAVLDSNSITIECIFPCDIRPKRVELDFGKDRGGLKKIKSVRFSNGGVSITYLREANEIDTLVAL